MKTSFMAFVVVAVLCSVNATAQSTSNTDNSTAPLAFSRFAPRTVVSETPTHSSDADLSIRDDQPTSITLTIPSASALAHVIDAASGMAIYRSSEKSAAVGSNLPNVGRMESEGNMINSDGMGQGYRER